MAWTSHSKPISKSAFILSSSNFNSNAHTPRWGRPSQATTSAARGGGFGICGARPVSMYKLWLFLAEQDDYITEARDNRPHAMAAATASDQTKQATLQMADIKICVSLVDCSLICLFVCLFVCVFACLLVCLLACLFVCLFACLFVCLRFDYLRSGKFQNIH